MKTTKFNTALLIVCLLSLGALSSCKKTVVGPVGADGAQGTAGKTGNANVKSVLFTVSNWRADSCCRNFYYKYHTVELTSSVIKDGAIMLYMGNDNGNEWKPMPLGTNGINFDFDVELSLLQIFITSTDGKSMPKNPGPQQFKLVIIPPAS